MTIELMVRLNEDKAINPMVSLGTSSTATDAQISIIEVEARNLEAYVAVTGNSTGGATTRRNANYNLGGVGQWKRIVWRTMSRGLANGDASAINWQVGSDGVYNRLENTNTLENPKYTFRNKNFIGKASGNSSYFNGTVGYLRIWTRGLGYGKSTTNNAWPQSLRQGFMAAAESSLSIPCVAGTFGSNYPNCTMCATGKVSTTNYSASCTDCPIGKYNHGTLLDASSHTSCSDCAAGTVSTSAGSSTCTECETGKYSTFGSGTGSSSCTDCGQGTYSSSTGAIACTDCESGKFANRTRSSSCTDCNAGSYSTNTVSTSCAICEAGKYSPDEGTTECTDCPVSKFILDNGTDISFHDDVGDCTDICASNKPVITFSPHVLSILPSESFALSATAATAPCTYYDTTAPLVPGSEFVYTVSSVTASGVLTAVVPHTTSLSDQRKITINSFSFEPDSNVTIQLTVMNQLNVTLTKVTSFAVGRAGLMAKIDGGEELTLPFQGTLTLDGGSSRDENYEDGGLSALLYSWSCIDTTQPGNEAECSPTFAATSAGTSSIEISDIPAQSNYKYTLLVSSSATGLNPASTFVTVFSQAVPTPIVTIDSNSLPVKVNPTAKFTIPASISLPEGTDESTSAITTWSILNATSGDSVELPDSSFSSVTSGTNLIPSNGGLPFPLVIKAFSLTPGKAYKFQISSMFEGGQGGESAVSSVSIFVNRAPTGGFLTVLDGQDSSNGHSGTALTTPFTLTAGSWADDDLPLSYAFSWRVQGNLESTRVGERGQANAIEKIYLPTGQILCAVKVYDSFDSYSEGSGVAIVAPPASVEAAMDSSSTLIEEAMLTGDNSGALAVISSTAQVLMATDCSSAPSCTSMNREDCGTYKAKEGGNNLCGDCLAGYFGLSGPEGAQACETVVAQCENGSIDDGESGVDCGGSDCPTCREGKGCNSAGDCESGVCDGGLCESSPKKCPSTTKGTECSGKGTCSYESSITYKPILKCPESDQTCSALCTCNDGFSGEACEYTDAQKLEAQTNRFKLLSSVLQVQEVEGDTQGLTDTSSSAADQASALKTIVSEPEELDATSVTLATSLLKSTVMSVRASTDVGAGEGDASVAEEDTLSLDITEAVSSLMSTSSIQDNSTFSEELNNIMESVAFLELDKLVEGEEPAILITENVKMSSVIINEALIKEKTFSPPSEGDEGTGNSPSSFAFPSGIRGDSGGGSGVVVTAWGTNPHATGGDQGGSLAVLGSIVKLAVTEVTEEGDGSRRRRRMVANSSTNLTVSCELPMAESLTTDLEFEESTVAKSVKIECIEGVNETKYAECPGQTYAFNCDGENSNLLEVNCTSASVQPVCGIFDKELNSWTTNNCFEVESSKVGVLKCICIFDSAVVSPDFSAMAETLGESFISTVLFGASNLFDLELIAENPTMFLALGGLVAVCGILCYWGIQLDEKEKIGERERVLVDYKMHSMAEKKKKATIKLNEEKRKEAIERLLSSDNELERLKGMAMKERTAAVNAKKRWNIIAKAAGKRNDVKVKMHMKRMEEEEGDGKGTLMGVLTDIRSGGNGDVSVARQIKASIPSYIREESNVGLFSKTVFQFHTLLFIMAKKYNGEGLDRPSKVAFLFTNLLNLMFVTAVTYELRAGSEIDLCSDFSRTSFGECVDGGGESPFDSGVSRCVWEFGSGFCTERPLGEDQWKIAAFLSLFTSIMTIPLNLALKKIFFSGILPPSLQATKEANKRYIEECKMIAAEMGEGEGEGEEGQGKKDEGEDGSFFGDVESWESQCLRFKKAEKQRKTKERAMMSDKDGPAGMEGWWWKLVPHGLAKIVLIKRLNEKKAHTEVMNVVNTLMNRRHEIVNAIGDLECRKSESYRFDLMLIAIGVNRSHLGVDQEGTRTDEEDRLRYKLALQEFDTLFSSGFGRFCKHLEGMEVQRRVGKVIWERWIFNRFNYVVADGKLKEFELTHTYGSHYFTDKFMSYRRKMSKNFWRDYVKTIGLEGFDGNNEIEMDILVDFEESLSIVYKLIKDDLTVQSELENQLLKLPTAQKGVRLMEFYNMGSLASIERVIYKMNMSTLKVLPLAIQEFNKYIYWCLVVTWCTFCIFYLLSFALKHGDEVIKLWLSAFFFGWFQKMFLNEPQVILVKHLFLPLLFIGTMEQGHSSSSKWQLKYHVFIHSTKTGVEKVPTSGAHRVAITKPDLSTSGYIIKHTATPTPLREDGNVGSKGEEIDVDEENTKNAKAVKYLEELKRASTDRLFRMALEQSSVDISAGSGIDIIIKRGKEAADKFEKSLKQAGKGQVDKAMDRFETIRHSKSGRVSQRKKKTLIRMAGLVLGFIFLIVFLDELGLGDVFLAALQCAVLWFMDGDTAWRILGGEGGQRQRAA